MRDHLAEAADAQMMSRRAFLRALPAAPLALLAAPAEAHTSRTVELAHQTDPKPLSGERGAEFLGSGFDGNDFLFFTQVTGQNPLGAPVGAIQTWRVR